MNTECVGVSRSRCMVREVEERSSMSRRARRLDLRSLGETYSFIIITELASPWPGRRKFTQFLSKPRRRIAFPISRPQPCALSDARTNHATLSRQPFNSDRARANTLADNCERQRTWCGEPMTLHDWRPEHTMMVAEAATGSLSVSRDRRVAVEQAEQAEQAEHARLGCWETTVRPHTTRSASRCVFHPVQASLSFSQPAGASG